MLGIMEETTSQVVIHSDEGTPMESETAKAKKMLKLTDFFKPPPKTPVQKPVDLLGYFSSKPSPSQQRNKLTGKGAEAIKSANQNAPPRPTKGKKILEGEGSKLKAGDSSKNFLKEDKGIVTTSSESENSKISKLSVKEKGRKTTKAKRKLKPTSPGSSADDFESPSTRKPKRPKLETTKLASKKKVFSLSGSDEEDNVHIASTRELPAGSKDEREHCKIDEQGSQEEPIETNETKEKVGDEFSVGATNDDASGGQAPAENNLKEGKDEKNEMVVISYEDFLNSEMDVTDETQSLSGENDGGDEMSGNESGVCSDTVLFISPGKAVPDEAGVTHQECEGSEDKEENGDKNVDGKALLDCELESSPERDAITDKNDDVFDDVRPLVDEEEDDISEKSSGSDIFCGKTVKSVNLTEDGKDSNQEDVSTPEKSQKINAYQSPKLLVSALVHSPQSGPSKEKADPALERTPKLLDRTSNVALDDLDNDISIIEVVKPPICKPVYSIFLKNKNAKNVAAEGQKTKIKGDDRDSEKKVKLNVTENKKGADNGNDGNIVKRGRGRPRKTDAMKKDDTSKAIAGGVGDFEKKEGRPKKRQNERESGLSKKQSSGRSKGKSSSSSSVETDNSGTRTLRPRGSTRYATDADDTHDNAEEVKDQREEEEGKKKEKGHAKIPKDDCKERKPESLAAGRDKNSRLLVKRNNRNQRPVKTNSKRAKEILKKAKCQKKPVQGLGLPSQAAKRTLRVRIDPLSISDDIVKRVLSVKNDTTPEDQEKKKETRTIKEKVQNTTTKNKAPVKLAPMFTKEGLKYLAKKQQQEADNATEIVTLSSDDECTTNDTAPLASPFTTLAVSKKWQAKVKVLEEQCPPPFPSICHILQKDDSESTWWNIPDVDQSKLRIPLNVQTQFSPSVDWNEPLSEFTFSDEANTRNPSNKFEKHPELTSEEQKAALEEISRHNPKFPVRRIFKRYLAKRKGEILEEKSTKEGSTDKGKAETGRCSRKRKTDSEDNDSERKVRRRSLRGQTVKEEQKPKAENPEPTNILWSDKYRPISSEEVLGNAAAVKKLGGWLSEWKIKIQRIKKKEARAQRGCKAAASQDDSESDFEPSDGGSSGSEDEDDDGVCNTLLITGPHGVGKTSMVYACAKEMGFKVIEVNASSKRAGKQILEDLGEATQSHQLSGQAGLRSANLASFFKLKTPPSLAKKQAKPAKPKIHKAFAAFVKAGQKPNNSADSKVSGQSKKTTPQKASVKKASKVSPKRASPEKVEATLKRNSVKSPRQVQKGLAPPPERAKSSVSGATLILFDEVDIVFEEDKGFLSAITSFMASTKRPIILTTSDNHFGDCLEGKFEHCALRKQDTARLVTSMQLLCLAENVVTDHQDMTNLVSLLGNDLRRCLHSLQTWVTTGALLPSLQQQTVNTSPLRRVCKLSLKRLKGTSDYSCLLKEDVQEEQVKMQKNGSDKMSKVHKRSLHSMLGCEATQSLGVILKRKHLSLHERNTSYNFIRKLSRCSVDAVRILERSFLQKICDDSVKLLEGLEDVETEKHSEATKEEDVAKAQKKMKQMFVDQMSGFADNLCALDVIESSMTDSCTSNVDKVSGQWWGVEMYSGIETSPDERSTAWRTREVTAELCSALELENYNYCRGNLDAIKSKYERMFDRKLRKEAASDPLRVTRRHSQEIGNLYGIIARKLPRVNRCRHRSISLDYLPTIRSVCRSEQLREEAHLKRRFLHYFDAVSFHVKVTDKVLLASVMEHFVRDSSQSNAEEKKTDEDEDE